MEVRIDAGAFLPIGRSIVDQIFKVRIMKSINLLIPDHLSYDETEWKIILAGELYEREKLTLGQAADLAGFSKRAFIEIMGRYGFSVFSNSVDDLISDIKNA
jgi:predicted HTH domain antitoxin